MIIFGSTTRQSVASTGVFHCPQCGIQREYSLVSNKRYFTLYFIPLIPMGSAGNYIQCAGCGGTYAEEVLTYDPEADRQQTLDNVKRMLIMVLLAGRLTDTRHIAKLQKVYADLTDLVITDEELLGELQMARRAEIDPMLFIGRHSANLNPEGKLTVLKSAREIISPDGPIGPDAQVLLRQLAEAMNMPTNHVNALLEQG